MEYLMNTFTIPFSLISLNEYIDAERSNKFKASKIKKDLTNNIGYFCKQLKLNDCQHDLVIVWTTKDKRKDTDNVAFAVKFILDAVVKMGKLPSDGYKHIRNISHIREIGSENIVVTFNKVQ